MRPIPARSLPTCNSRCGTRRSAGWQRRSTGASKPLGQYSRASSCCHWSFSEQMAAEKYMPQLQHNMWVVAAQSAVLSVITGGGKWVEIETHADPLYQHLIVTAERKFWRCVESGEPPRLFGVGPPKTRIEAVRIVDMEHLKFMGRIGRNLPQHPTSLSGARARQGRAKSANAGRCQEGDWTWRPRQAFKVRGDQL